MGESRSRDTLCLDVEMDRIEDHGSELLVHVRVAARGDIRLLVAMPSSFRRTAHESGEHLRLAVPLRAIHFFDGQGRRIDAGTQDNVTEIAWPGTRRESLA
jgi:hypothetical protein